MPLEQTETAFARLHVAPQPPQLARLVKTLVSQPLARSLSQLAKGMLQMMPQLPPVQVAVPLVLLQMLPQPPQLLMSPVVLVSQPFAALPSQLPKPALQLATVQVPPAQP